MTAHRFYTKEIPEESVSAFLEGQEHHHLSKVARIQLGEQVWLFDDSGNEYRARVEEIGKEKTSLQILERQPGREPDVKITLAQVILKTKKMEWVIQKATELGVDVIVPLISDRTVVKLEGIQEKKRDRWKRLAIEASKQSGRSVVPEIIEPLSLKAFIRKEDGSKKLFLSERGGRSLREFLIIPFRKGLDGSGSVILLVGPEGGWTETEEQDIMNGRFEAVSLGQLTLRAETAAIVSLAMVSHFWKKEDVS